MLADRLAIDLRLPHAGSMCLIDAVIALDGNMIECITTTHLHHDNPLRAGGRLGSVAALEYALQAMALHAGWLTEDSSLPRFGLLATVRDLELHTNALDTIKSDLHVWATQLIATDAGFTYDFEVGDGTQICARGRATVIHVEN